MLETLTMRAWADSRSLGQQEVGEEERADVVGRVGQVEAILAEARGSGDASVVHEDVQAAAIGQHLVSSRPNGGKVGEVKKKEAGRGPGVSIADGLQHGCGPIGGTGRQDHRRSAGGKGLDQRPTDARVGPRYQKGAVL